jgi:hypothetical protein
MAKRPRKQEGAALFVVLLIVMVGTASAVFSASTVSHEVRGSGFARQQLQTRYTARAGLVGGLEWIDVFGPETVRNIMQTQGDTQGVDFDCVTGGGCYPEPPLPGGRRAYRLSSDHFAVLLSPDGGTTPGLLENLPYKEETSFGQGSAYTPMVVIDLYDEHIVSILTPGAAGQGGTKFKYMRTTLTARTRAQLKTADHTDAEDYGRQKNETGADMRAYVVSGPIDTGSL